MTIEFSVSLIAILMLFMTVSIIYAITQFVRTTQKTETFIDHLEREIIPTLRQFDHLSRDLQELIRNADRQVTRLESSIELIEEVSQSASRLNREFLQKANKSSILGFAAAIIGMIKGKDFLDKYFQSKEKK